MFIENSAAEGQGLFSYTVASGDMRHIGIAERTLFLRFDPRHRPFIRGEVPGCGSGCFADLSHVLLEYVMGCEDCREANLAWKSADRFGQRLGKALLSADLPEAANDTGAEALAGALRTVLNSMNVPFTVEDDSRFLRFALAYCPLHREATISGMTMWVALAHRAFVSLLETVIAGRAPGWSLETPAERESEVPLEAIVLARP